MTDAAQEVQAESTAPVRVEHAPEKCPRCGRVNMRSDHPLTKWHRYTLIPGAPAVGCGACSYVVYVGVEAVKWTPPPRPGADRDLSTHKKPRRRK